MKKIVILAALMMLVFSGSAFAALATLGANTASTAGYSIYGGVDAADAVAASAVLLGKMSKGVSFAHNTAATGVGYSCGTKHTSGTKAYGTAHDSTAIYFQDVGVSAGIPNLSAASTSSFGAQWTAM